MKRDAIGRLITKAQTQARINNLKRARTAKRAKARVSTSAPVTNVVNMIESEMPVEHRAMTTSQASLEDLAKLIVVVWRHLSH
jgi:hypothetical protein